MTEKCPEKKAMNMKTKTHESCRWCSHESTEEDHQQQQQQQRHSPLHQSTHSEHQKNMTQIPSEAVSNFN